MWHEHDVRHGNDAGHLVCYKKFYMPCLSVFVFKWNEIDYFSIAIAIAISQYVEVNGCRNISKLAFFMVGFSARL